jgi:predicted metal-dependent hydrolase
VVSKARHVSTLEVDGLRVELQRRQMKTVRLSARPDGSIRLSAPHSVDEALLRNFIRKNRDWVIRERDRSLTARAPSENFRHGGRVRLWGQWHEVVRAPGARAKAELVDGRVRIVAPDDAGAARAVDRLRRKEIGEALARIAPDLEAHVGQTPAGYRFRAMTSRWGTCNVVTRQITLNTWLVQRSVSELEYVVAHELAHLVESGHGPRFRAVLDRVVPDWRRRRTLLQSVLPPRD